MENRALQAASEQASDDSVVCSESVNSPFVWSRERNTDPWATPGPGFYVNEQLFTEACAFYHFSYTGQKKVFRDPHCLENSTAKWYNVLSGERATLVLTSKTSAEFSWITCSFKVGVQRKAGRCGITPTSLMSECKSFTKFLFNDVQPILTASRISGAYLSTGQTPRVGWGLSRIKEWIFLPENL